MDQPTQTITLNFTRDSYQKLEKLAIKMNMGIPDLIGKSLALFMTVQDKTIILKTSSSETLEIKKYEYKS